MPSIEEFSEEFHKKQLTVEGFNRYLRQGNEFEVIVGTSDWDTIRRGMQTDISFATNKGLNDGNGFNNDMHSDGGCVIDYIPGTRRSTYGMEISTSPYESFSFSALRKEAEERIRLLDDKASGIHHGNFSSTHVHNSVAYFSDGYGPNYVIKGLPKGQMLQNIARFLLKYMPVMKWLSMTCPNGARAAQGNTYDKCDNDMLFNWFYDEREVNYLFSMNRGSYLRTYGALDEERFHWENRMLDCCASPSVLAAWLMLNRAINMLAFDLAKQGHLLALTKDEVDKSREMMHLHMRGWKHVDVAYIKEKYVEMKSILCKYFKKAGSLDAFTVMDRLIEFPIPAWIEENGLTEGYRLIKVEDMFATRQSSKDEALHSAYLEAIRTFAVPMAENLDSFNSQIAAHLKIEKRKAVSLYQMFRRENVEIEFLGGRLVYMGD